MADMTGFRCSPEGDFIVTEEVKNYFDLNGFIIVRQLLKGDELSALKQSLENNTGLRNNTFKRNDGEGGKVSLVLWHVAADDISGAVTRCDKVAGTMEQLLDGEVYHYHTKLIKKDAFTGGAHIWHQDYGYWYDNGCLFPDMGTVFIAIDKTDQLNGCLKVLRGSHKMGRVDHTRSDGSEQAGADMARVEEAMKVCDLIHVELEAGDGLFFHCNLLHRSDQNRSPNRRWAYLVAYNRASNNPIREHHHPRYIALQKVANSTILANKSKDMGDDLKFWSGQYQGGSTLNDALNG